MKKSTCLRGLALLLVLLLSVVPLSACQTEKKPVVSESPEPQTAAFDASTLTQEQMLEDYDYMWKALEENYPYFELCKRVYGTDEAEIKNSYYKQLKSTDLTGDELLFFFYSTISQALGSFKMAGHLCAIGFEEFHLGQDTNDSPEPGDPTAEIFNSKQASIFYRLLQSRYGAPDSDSQNVPAESINSTDYIKQLFSVSEEDGIPVFKIRSFSTRNTEDAEEYVRQLSEAILNYIDAPDLILDVRGNGGGSTYPWQNGLLPYLYCNGRTRLSYTVVGAYKDGALNRTFWGRDLTTDSGLETATIEDIDFLRQRLPSLESFVPEDLNGMNNLISSVIDQQYCGTADTLFRGRLWILQDDSCASATEDLLQLSKRTGIATLVGMPSHGIASYIIPPAFIRLLLPNSGIIIKFTPFYTFDENGGPYEFNGTTPDILCSSGDAMMNCLRAIKAQ